MYTQEKALALLSNYQPMSDQEKQAQQFIWDFITANTAYWSRQTLTGHITGSAWITNIDDTKAVLLHHKKLDMWVQPGGHIDSGDASLFAASAREAREETGIKELTPVSDDIFDLDVHKIPERKNEPEHWHLDIRFWFRAAEETLHINDESNHLAWLTRAQIEEKTNEESVLRMVRKTMAA